MKFLMRSQLDKQAQEMPKVSGESAKHALDLAFKITRQIQEE